MSNTLLKKVLWVDDDKSLFDVLRPRLGKCGVFLIWAGDGKEGIAKTKIEMPELIITDIVMPRMNGFDFMKVIKSSPMTENIPFLVISDWGEARMVHDREFLDALGIAKYLIKSSHSASDIIKEIRQILSL